MADSNAPAPLPSRIRRSPTIAEIAAEAGVGTATVDRIINGRAGVREQTRKRVLKALAHLSSVDAKAGPLPLATHRVAFLADSGRSYVDTLESAVWETVRQRSDIEATFEGITTSMVDPIKFANLLERTAETAQALVVVAREHLIINRAIRNIVGRGVPVICLTTDLPTSGRTVYVGNDQTGAGATAAYLMGQAVGNREGNILLVYSAPYRVQEERELGFRRILRAEYPLLKVDERVNSNDDTALVYANVVRYIADHGPPAGIYNVAAGNVGIGKALSDHNLAGKTVFIGHELNANSRMLMETGVMNFAIGHDVTQEVELAINCAVQAAGRKAVVPPAFTRIRIYTKYSCN
jgi:LacI family transcriptional regulator